MKNDRGFTLVELIITIIIVAILIIAATIVYKEYIKRSYTSEGWTLLGTIQTAQKLYYSGHSSFGGQEEMEKEIDASNNKYFTSFTIEGGGTQSWTAITEGINEASGISLTMTGSADSSVSTSGIGSSDNASGSSPVPAPGTQAYTTYVNQLLADKGFTYGNYAEWGSDYIFDKSLPRTQGGQFVPQMVNAMQHGFFALPSEVSFTNSEISTSNNELGSYLYTTVGKDLVLTQTGVDYYFGDSERERFYENLFSE